jgi:hypothetical protein
MKRKEIKNKVPVMRPQKSKVPRHSATHLRLHAAIFAFLNFHALEVLFGDRRQDARLVKF